MWYASETEGKVYKKLPGMVQKRELLLLESLHDSRLMLGAGSSSGVELFQVFMCTRLWQDRVDQQVFHCLFIPTFARCLSILVESQFLHKGFASSSTVWKRLRLDHVGHASLEPAGSYSLWLKESIIFMCGVVWRGLDQRVSLRVRALPSRGSTEWRKMCLDYSPFQAETGGKTKKQENG